jgi:hypothetical protein
MAGDGDIKHRTRIGCRVELYAGELLGAADTVALGKHAPARA